MTSILTEHAFRNVSHRGPLCDHVTRICHLSVPLSPRTDYFSCTSGRPRTSVGIAGRAGFISRQVQGFSLLHSVIMWRSMTCVSWCQYHFHCRGLNIADGRERNTIRDGADSNELSIPSWTNLRHFIPVLLMARAGTLRRITTVTCFSSPLCHYHTRKLASHVTRTSRAVANKTNSVALSPRANYTDWWTATCRRNLVSTFCG
jgi:hypothetical protein